MRKVTFEKRLETLDSWILFSHQLRQTIKQYRRQMLAPKVMGFNGRGLRLAGKNLNRLYSALEISTQVLINVRSQLATATEGPIGLDDQENVWMSTVDLDLEEFTCKRDTASNKFTLNFKTAVSIIADISRMVYAMHSRIGKERDPDAAKLLKDQLKILSYDIKNIAYYTYMASVKPCLPSCDGYSADAIFDSLFCSRTVVSGISTKSTIVNWPNVYSALGLAPLQATRAKKSVTAKKTATSESAIKPLKAPANGKNLHTLASDIKVELLDAGVFQLSFKVSKVVFEDLKLNDDKLLKKYPLLKEKLLGAKTPAVWLITEQLPDSMTAKEVAEKKLELVNKAIKNKYAELIKKEIEEYSAYQTLILNSEVLAMQKALQHSVVLKSLPEVVTMLSALSDREGVVISS